MVGFITGSHAYGVPQPDSDLDVVLSVTPKEWDAFMSITDVTDPGNTTSPTPTIRTGRLRIVLCSELRLPEYNLWRRGTDDLQARAPVSQEEAIAYFEALRAAQMAGNE